MLHAWATRRHPNRFYEICVWHPQLLQTQQQVLRIHPCISQVQVRKISFQQQKKLKGRRKTACKCLTLAECFRDLTQDMSVSLLFSSHKYGPHFIEAYQQVANSATYKKHRNGATSVYINNMKIYQYPRGDVVVLSGNRYIR